MEAGCLSEQKMLVFLCYAREDSATVDTLYDQLSSFGYQPWMDRRDIIAGQDWDTVIEMTIDKADAILVCLSESFVGRPGSMHRELVRSLKRAESFRAEDCFLISVKLNPCEAPHKLKHLQYIELYSPKGYQDLLRSLNCRADALGMKSLSPADGFSRLSPDVVESMLASEAEATQALAKAACALVKAGRLQPEALLKFTGHPYFLIRKLAIEAIIENDSPQTLELLHGFRNTSYHVSQDLVRNYIVRHLYEMDRHDIELSCEILDGFNSAPKVSDNSRLKNNKLLVSIRALRS